MLHTDFLGRLMDTNGISSGFYFKMAFMHKTTPSIGKLANLHFQPNLSSAGAGPPGVWGGPKWAINLQGNHMKPLIPKTSKSVQPFSQKMATKPFWPLINIIL